MLIFEGLSSLYPYVAKHPGIVGFVNTVDLDQLARNYIRCANIHFNTTLRGVPEAFYRIRTLEVGLMILPL